MENENKPFGTLYKVGEEPKIIYPKNGKDFKLEELQEIVHGYIEVVYLKNKDILICNEEGKLKGYKYNKLATKIYRLHGNTNDFIVGDILICNEKLVK